MGTKNNPGAYDCYHTAHPDEPMFVLLGRDPFAPMVVEYWAELREKAGEDLKVVVEARRCANEMREELTRIGKRDASKVPYLHRKMDILSNKKAKDTGEDAFTFLRAWEKIMENIELKGHEEAIEGLVQINETKLLTDYQKSALQRAIEVLNAEITLNKKDGPPLVVFFRKQGWYPIELMFPDACGRTIEEQVQDHVDLNEGTTRVEDLDGNVLWRANPCLKT